MGIWRAERRNSHHRRAQCSLQGGDPVGLLISEAKAQKDEKARLSLLEGREWRLRKFRFT